MARQPMSSDALLAVSRRCAEVIARQGTTATTRELVAASGLSERTFFRYFPTKAESLRPLLDEGNRRFVAEVTRLSEAPGFQLLQIVADAFTLAFGSRPMPVERELLKTILAAPPYRRMWLETNERIADQLVAPFARALGVAETAIDARMAADVATLLAIRAVRHMVVTDDSPAESARLVAESIARLPLTETFEQHNSRSDRRGSDHGPH